MYKKIYIYFKSFICFNSACSYGWKYYNNNCYTMIGYETLEDFDPKYGGILKANQFCQSLNPKASLAMPKTKNFLNFLMKNWKIPTSGFWVIFL